MAELRKNTSEDDFEIITSGEGTQFIAEKLALIDTDGVAIDDLLTSGVLNTVFMSDGDLTGTMRKPPGTKFSTISPSVPYNTPPISNGASADFILSGFQAETDDGGFHFSDLRFLPSGAISSYHVEGYRSSGFSTRQYLLSGVDSSSAGAVLEQDTQVDLLDDDNGGQVYLRISNNDPTNPRSFTITGEGFTLRQ